MLNKFDICYNGRVVGWAMAGTDFMKDYVNGFVGNPGEKSEVGQGTFDMDACPKELYAYIFSDYEHSLDYINGQLHIRLQDVIQANCGKAIDGNGKNQRETFFELCSL